MGKPHTLFTATDLTAKAVSDVVALMHQAQAHGMDLINVNMTPSFGPRLKPND